MRRRLPRTLLVAVCASAAPMAQAHTGDAAGEVSPWLVGLLALSALGYAVGYRRLHSRRTPRAPRRKAIAFAAGLTLLAAALLPPLDRWSADSFAAHMLQHELLMLGAAPLLVLGHPLPVFLWSLPRPVRAAIGRLTRAAPVAFTWRSLTQPFSGWLLHAAALWAWHVPAAFRAALATPWLHELQHATFLATALAFWSSLLMTRGSTQHGAAVLYLFTTTVHTSVLGALITFASRPLYAPDFRPEGLWDALTDQQIGGLLMWVPGSAVYVGIGVLLLLQWVRRSEPG